LSADYYLSTLDKSLADKYTSTTITIPLKEEGEEVVIDTINDLPLDSSELCTLLTNEESDKEYWLLVAKAYANNGKVEEALNVIKNALNSPHIVDSTSDVQSSLHGFLSWLYLVKSGPNVISLDLAMTETKTALSLDSTSDLNLLAQGCLFLGSKQITKRTNFEKELRVFDQLLKRDAKNCYALIGKAKVYFYKENYLSALKLFQRCLVLNPLLRPDPRIGIGLCFWYLDRKELANQAWKNALHVNPENLQVKILLSLCKFDDCFLNSTSDDDFKEKYSQALDFAKASYLDDPTNDVIQIVLASYYFSKEEYSLVEKLSEHVLKYTKTSFVRSYALFWLARVKFAAKDFMQAQKLFSDSIKANDANLLSKLGYGQCLVIRNELNDAIRIFEKIQESNPRILEVLYALGMLYAKNKKTIKKAIDFLEKYVALANEQKEPVSLSALVTLSNVYEDSNISQSLKYLMIAKEQESKAGASLSYSLLNNIGVFTLLKKESNPLSYFEDALKSLQSNENEISSEKLNALSITLNYNIARCKEYLGNTDEAFTMYEDILSKCPNYVSAKLRWLLITCSTKDESIKEEFAKLIEEFKDDLEVRSFYGWYLKKFGKKHHLTTTMESDHHRETLVNYTSHDSYALVSLGNVYCSLARENKDAPKKEQYYFRAAQLYQKALTLDSKNAYAAQGIAIIFADKKQTGLALEIFKKMRDSLNDVCIFINLGHCLLDLKQYSKAIEAYQLASDRFTDGSDVTILNFIARAWLYRGLTESNLTSLKTALEISEKVRGLSDLVIFKFNVAFIQFQIAEFIKRLPTTKRTMGELEDSLTELQQGIIVLEELANSQGKHVFPVDELKARIGFGASLVKQLEKAIEEQKEYEAEIELRFKEAKMLKEKEEKQKEMERLKSEEEKLEMEKKLAEERKKLEEKAQEWNQMRLEEEKDNNDDLDVKDDDNKKKTKKSSKK
ncbi:hypothetical protein CANARDRAFT_182562, partial [[Candida] arabinofermentans NRRL YB-2248]